MKAHTVHAVRFYKPKPRAGHTCAYDKERKLLAVSRENGSIEVYNFKNSNAPLLQFCIPPNGSELDRSIEALAFVPDGRLFSVGLHGFVFQHYVCENAIENPSVPEFWPVTSGAAWCMKYNRSRNKLAIGTEEGFVCIFDVTSDGLSFDKILDKQEGRVLSLDWHHDGFHIVTGSTDTIRLWDVESGQPLQRMSTGRLEKRLETIVWSVLMLNDFTVVSGDSRGKTSFWNSRNGTLLDSYQSHKGDILTVTCNQDQTVIYASGADPTIVHFQSVVTGENKMKWMKSIQRYVNTHDVHAMIVLPEEINRVISIGVDANLFVDNPRKKASLIAYPPFQWGSNVSLASQAKILCLRHDCSIEVWKLGDNQAPKSNLDDIMDCDNALKKPVEILKVTDEPVKLLEIKCNETETIHNMAISPCGQYLAYCTKMKLKLLKISVSDQDQLKIDKIAISIKKTPHLLTFGSGGNHLFVADNAGYLSLYSFDEISASLQSEMKFDHGISHIVADGPSLCAIGDFKNNVTICDLSSNEEGAGKIQCKAPKYEDAPISCMALHPKTKTLFVVYSNHHFVECCTKTGKYTKLTMTLHENEELIPKEWKTKAYPTKVILFPQAHLKSGILSKKSDTILFYDEQLISVLDRPALMNCTAGVVPSASKQTKKEGLIKDSTTAKKSDVEALKKSVLRLSKRYEYLVFMGTLTPENDEDLTSPLVAVEVKPQVLQCQLPPSMRRKKFGAM